MEQAAQARYARRAGLIGLGALGYLAASLALQLAAGLALRAAFPGATLANPAGLGHSAGLIVQLAVTAGSLAIPAGLLILVLRPGRARLGLVPPAPGGMALWTPMALGAAMLANLLAGALGMGAGQQLELPRAGAPLFWAFLQICLVPALGEELLFRGVLQGTLRPGGGEGETCSGQKSALFRVRQSAVSGLHAAGGEAAELFRVRKCGAASSLQRFAGRGGA